MVVLGMRPVLLAEVAEMIRKNSTGIATCHPNKVGLKPKHTEEIPSCQRNHVSDSYTDFNMILIAFFHIVFVHKEEQNIPF